MGMKTNSFRLACLAFTAALVFSLPALAQYSETPQGTVGEAVIKSSLTVRHGGSKRVLSPRDISSLPMKTLVTITPWSEKPMTFVGPLLVDVLAAAGTLEAASLNGLKAIALNEFWAKIPAEDLSTVNPIIAILADGAPMPVRERGPFWIVYPQSGDAESKPAWKERMVWQLKVLDIP